MSFAIVVDSVADLSEEECARFGITSVPLSVEVGGETFKDQAEISSEEFYDKMIASDTLPKSSQPSPSEFMDIYNALASEGADEIIAIHIAAVLSGTSESSNLAANQVEVPVEVIDSFNACSGQGLLALLACEMRDAGASAQECAQAIKDARAHTRFFIACGTLDNLLAGGRLSAEEVDAATLLDIKPMMSFDERGVLKAFDKAKGMNGVIKKHELTRRDKEEDRMKHVRVNNANIEPVFFAYPDNAALDAVISRYTVGKPVYDFIAPGDGFGHTFWIIDKQEDIDAITQEFAKMPALYIADGHHRSAAAALVGAEKAKQNPNHRGDEEYNYFMAVCFPANQLTIIDYNRVVKDLNGMTPEEFLAAVGKNFIVEEKGEDIYKPSELHNFSLYLNGKWYSLTAKPGTYNDNDPIGVLDVTISSNLILDEVLGIKDLRSDKRIDFVGGIRGLGELKKRVDSGEMKVALALYPVSMKQLMDIADTGNIMPPKTTWFEPKLRSGLVIHKLD